MKTLILLVLVLLGAQAFGQAVPDSVSLSDTLSLENALELATADTTQYYYEDTTYNHVQYTQKPGELAVTQEELQKKYQPKKFSKTEWKRIVGTTRYDETAEKQVEKKQLPSFALNPLVYKVLPYIVIFGLIGFLIFMFVKQAMNAKNNKIRTQQAALFSDQTTPEDLEDLDLEKLLREALAQNNLRLAVRLYYIKLLKHLDREGYLRWEKNKTNRDYAEELALAGFSREFRKLMVAYEYVWYGERTPSTEEFSTLESGFKNLYKAQRA